jgi:hypothetical protein
MPALLFLVVFHHHLSRLWMILPACCLYDQLYNRYQCIPVDLGVLIKN